MWLYFNSNGTLVESLEHGPAARAGTTDFQIFAYFQGVDLAINSLATIKLFKPDLTHSSYPLLAMRRADLKYEKKAGENSSYFAEDGGPHGDGIYPGFLFDFSNFSGDQNVAILLDTPGLWEAVISLYGIDHIISVQGTSTFNVQYGNVNNDGTEISFDEIMASFSLVIAGKLNIEDGIVVVDNILADISNYNEGQIFFDKQFRSYWIKGSNNSLQGFDVKLERAVTLTGTETIANLVLPDLDIANWGIGKYNDNLLFVKVIITTTPTPHLEYTIYQLSNNGEIKCWYNDNATGNETIAQVLATTPTNVYATKSYVDSTFAKPSDLVYKKSNYQVFDITTTTISDIYSNVETSETFNVGGSNLLFRGTYLLEKGSNLGSNYNFKITCIKHNSVDMIGRYWETTLGGVAPTTTLITIFNSLSNTPATTKYVNDKIADFMQREYQNVDTTTYPTLDDFLASTGTEGYIYLYPTGVNNDYYQYIWESNGWVSLGTTQLALSGYVKKTQTIIGVDLQNDITKPEFVEALCDVSLSPTSNNPVRNKVITKVLDVSQLFFSVGNYTNDNAPYASFPTTNALYGLTFDKEDLESKDINKIKTRLCCFNANAVFPRTIRLKIYNTSFTSLSQDGSVTLDNPIYTKDFVMAQNGENFDLNVDISYENLTKIFVVAFQDMSYTNSNQSGLYIANCDKSGYLGYKNGDVTAYGSDPTNYIRFGGTTYASWKDKYLELGYYKVDFVKKDELNNYVEKELVGFEKQANPNIWNKNEEVLHSWASPSNGVIETYPDNPYINNYLRSGYIPVKKNTGYILSIFQNVGYGGRVYACYYNKSKVFISGGQVNGTTAGPINGTTFTTPDNDSLGYVIISINQLAITPLQLEEGSVASPYHEYTGDKYLLQNVRISTDQIFGNEELNKIINLPDELYAVVGDKFEMFYKGILKVKSFENMYVEITCDIGKAYQRKFEVTPTNSNIGNHNLLIQVYDNNQTMIDNKTINLKIVAKTTSPSTNKNVLCMGDSLTSGGWWVAELHRRINLTNSTSPTGENAPQGLGLSNITFIGKNRTSNGAGFEGFGGWRFSTYLDPSTSTDDYWITANGHNKTNDDQESIWQANNGTQWQLETIESNRIKIKKYSGSGTLPANGTLTWISGGIHIEDIVYTNSTLAEGNPFAYNGVIDFNAYCQDLGIDTIHEVYILLGWNNLATALSTYKSEAKQFIDLLRAFNPAIKIVLMGLQIPSADGMANNYGANSTYNYRKGQSFVFDLNNLYQEIAGEYANGVSFVNIASQFDTEYCMQFMDTTPNSRVFTTIQVQSNGVHPAISGYYQIADVVYRWINAKINN